MEKDRRIMENMIQIALTAGYLSKEERICIEDSMDFALQVEKLALKFEEQYDEEQGDYLGEIDSFANTELIELYGEPSRIRKVGVVCPEYCDQKYIRDRDMTFYSTSDEDAIDQYIKYFHNWLRPDEYKLVKVIG